MLRLALSIAGLFYAVSSVNAETLIGLATVVDGDTIKISAQSIRLHGIDAPESNQPCMLDGVAYECGEIATMALDNLVSGNPVVCVGDERDRWERLIATCATSGTDIAAWMVRVGMAVAFTEYSDEYVPEQRIAVEAQAGMWAGEFQTPANWRAGRRAQ